MTRDFEEVADLMYRAGLSQEEISKGIKREVEAFCEGSGATQFAGGKKSHINAHLLEAALMREAQTLADSGNSRELRLLGLLMVQTLRQARVGGTGAVEEVQQVLRSFAKPQRAKLNKTEAHYVSSYARVFVELLEGRSVAHKALKCFGFKAHWKAEILNGYLRVERDDLSQKYFNYGLTGVLEGAGEWLTVKGARRLREMRTQGRWFEERTNRISGMFYAAFLEAERSLNEVAEAEALSERSTPAE